jgi:transposase
VTHGGKRPGAGKKRIPLDIKRLFALKRQGLSQKEIAAKFGVSQNTISMRLRQPEEQIALPLKEAHEGT